MARKFNFTYGGKEYSGVYETVILSGRDDGRRHALTLQLDKTRKVIMKVDTEKLATACGIELTSNFAIWCEKFDSVYKTWYPSGWTAKTPKDAGMFGELLKLLLFDEKFSRGGIWRTVNIATMPLSDKFWTDTLKIAGFKSIMRFRSRSTGRIIVTYVSPGRSDREFRNNSKKDATKFADFATMFEVLPD